MRVPLLGGSYSGISTNTSSQEAINFYYEAPAPGESHIGAALPVHGASLFATIANAGVIRGLLYNPVDSLLYVVSGNTLYEVTSGAIATSRGTLNTSTGYVQMSINPSTQDILIVDGNEARNFNCTTNTFSTVSDADFPDTATCVFFLNGYFLVNVPTTPGRFQYSDLNSGLAWTAASFATAASLQSYIVGMIEHNDVIYFLGDQRGELFYNEGSSTSTFTKLQSLNVGIAASGTLQKFDNSVAFLGRSQKGELNVVHMGPKYVPEVISTPELSRKWEQLSSVSDAFAYVILIDGHEFYILTFPTGNATYAYDAVTKMWHQRSGAFSAGSPTREKINAVAFCGAWGGHVAGDFNATGKLFSLQETVYTFDSVNMERRLTGPILATENEAVLRVAEVQVDIEEGVATGGEAGDDGQLRLNYSKDAGHTYSTGVLLNLGVGGTTGYATRLMKRKCGKARTWNFRIYTDTPRKIIVKGAYGRIFGEPKEGFSAVAKK